MLRFLYPQLFVQSIFYIKPEELHKHKIKGILLDLDNTIIMRDADTFSTPVIEWISELRREGFKLAIISNNSKKRVVALADLLQIPSVYWAIKPLKYSFRRALKVLGTECKETAIIGDQLFTDVLGGNLMGLYTILVVPMTGKESVFTKVNRYFEKIFWPGLRVPFNNKRWE